MSLVAGNYLTQFDRSNEQDPCPGFALHGTPTAVPLPARVYSAESRVELTREGIKIFDLGILFDALLNSIREDITRISEFMYFTVLPLNEDNGSAFFSLRLRISWNRA